MAIVFVLVNSELGAEQKTLTALQSIEAVKEAYLVYGVYDIIAKTVAESMDVIKTVVLDQIRAIPEIQSTLTMVVVESGG